MIIESTIMSGKSTKDIISLERSEIVELMWQFAAPYLDADRWSKNFRREREAEFRELAAAELDIFIQQRSA